MDPTQKTSLKRTNSTYLSPMKKRIRSDSLSPANPSPPWFERKVHAQPSSSRRKASHTRNTAPKRVSKRVPMTVNSTSTSQQPSLPREQSAPILILHHNYLEALLASIDNDFSKEHRKARPHYLSIMAVIIEDFRGAHGFGRYLSHGHVDHGDDWLRWKLSDKVSDCLLALILTGGAQEWEEGRIDEAERTLAYWRELDDKFNPKEGAEVVQLKEDGDTDSDTDRDAEGETDDEYFAGPKSVL